MVKKLLSWLSCCCLCLQAEELNEVQSTLNLLEKSHRSLQSYIARYQVQSSEGKKMRLTIAQDHREKLSAVITEFFEDGENSHSMITLSSPELGQMVGPSGEAIHYTDIQLVFGKLQEVLSAGDEFKDLEAAQLRWTPSFHLGKSNVNIGLGVSFSNILPWKNSESEFSNESVVSEEGEDFVFLTPEKISYRVNRKSGLLVEQLFEDDPERRVSLTDFELNPASEKIQKIITQHRPKDAKIESFAQSPLFMKMNLTFAGILIAAVDQGDVSTADFQKFLVKARPALGEYLSLALPNSHSLILPEERWVKLFDTMLSTAREKFETQGTEDPQDLDWVRFKAKMMSEQREPMATLLLQSLSKRLELDDVITEEQLDADTIDGFTAIEMLFMEVKRAMVYAAIESAMKKYWDDAE